MRIINFGSSHSVGYGLNDVKDKHHDTLSEYAFPSLVAKYFGCELVNYAKCGNSIDQMNMDVLAYLASAREDDFVILQVSTNPNWFKLIATDNSIHNIVNPDSLNHKGLKYSAGLRSLMGALTGDNHWRRMWFIHFYSLANLLLKSNIKFVWFFDRYLIEYIEFDDEIQKMPEPIKSQIQLLRQATGALEPFYLNQIYADYLNANCPDSIMENGHYNEIGHKFWTEKVLLPGIETRLTQ